MTVEQAYKIMQEKRKPVRKECSTCMNMPSCWHNNPQSFELDAVKDCWEPRPVPSYIKNIELK